MIHFMEGDTFTKLGTAIAAIVIVWAMFKRHFPYELRDRLEKDSQRAFSIVYPYIQITFPEFTREPVIRSEAYSAIQTYLSSSSLVQAKRLKVEAVKNHQSFVLNIDDHEVVADHFEGVRVWWTSGKSVSKSQTVSVNQVTDEKRYYELRFHKKNRELVIGPYLHHVLMAIKNRQHKLFTNNGSSWSHAVFEHPATFETLAMEATKKGEIFNDLVTFTKSEEFYARIGRPWRRGYLIHGLPGTGKSTMIAAMANFLKYDVYDLKLTAVKNDTELRKLLIETSKKSILAIEDIDCSVDLTGQRWKKGTEELGNPTEKEEKPKLIKEERDKKSSRVSLSGLLNSIDGLWSAGGGGRIIVFTTSSIEKLDPALSRKGRMDKHIELSYCNFEAFKVFANNYLQIDQHNLFRKISDLLEKIKMTPADVADYLMPGPLPWDADGCLERLIKGLKMEETKLKAEQEAQEKKGAAEKEENKDSISDDKKAEPFRKYKDATPVSSYKRQVSNLAQEIPSWTAFDSTAHDIDSESKSPYQMTRTADIAHEAGDQATQSSLKLTENAELEKLPHEANEEMQHKYSSLETWIVSDVAQLTKLPIGLQRLRIERCENLDSLPKEILNNNCPLQHLYIIDCGSLVSFPISDDHTALTTLHIRNCRKLQLSLSLEMMHQFQSLEHLSIESSCDSLTSFPLNLFPRLRILCLLDCNNLKSLTVDKGLNKEDLNSLEVLEIRNCPNLDKQKSFPEGLPAASKLSSIFFSNCQSLQSLPIKLCDLNSLGSLFISKCPELKSLPHDGFPPSLNLFCINSCDKITIQREWGLNKLDVLRHFEIEGGCADINSFPNKDLLPVNLVSLHISRLMYLKSLDQVGLQQLTSLEKLEINCCRRLRFLPMEFPPSLSTLSIKECPLLRAKLQNKKGADWSRIAHIPNIYIDEEESY